MSLRIQLALLVTTVVAGSACVFHHPRPDLANETTCNTNIVMTRVYDVQRVPNPDDIANDTDVRLTLLKDLGHDRFLFKLTDGDCSQAIERLRRDPRVRSVELAPPPDQQH